MYILKRSFYYITRKKGKTITIGIILFIVATLVLTSLVINNAANKTFEVVKNKLSSNIIYKVDTSSIVTHWSSVEKQADVKIKLEDDKLIEK